MAKREVGATSDYKKFKVYKENRDVDPQHLRKLVENIEKRNLLVDMPIIIDKDWYVIDGQTRLEAAKTLQVPVHYTVARKAERKDISTLNMQGKTWILADWMKYYCSLKNKHYLKFRKFIKDCDLSLANGLILFGVFKDRKNIFKNGQFTYPEDDSFQWNVVMQLNEWNELFDYIKRKRTFISAIFMLNFYELYDHKRMIKKTKEKLKQKQINFDLSNRESIIVLLNEIYNDKMTDLVYFPRTPRKRLAKKSTD